MAKTAGNSSESWQQTLALAKVLLRNYGILHEIQAEQLKRYPIACCNISIDGSASIDGDKKSVTFEIKTSREYYIEAGKSVKRHKYSPTKLTFTSKKYSEELKMATTNLTNWTKGLLWGDDTIVEVIIDGSKVIAPEA